MSEPTRTPEPRYWIERDPDGPMPYVLMERPGFKGGAFVAIDCYDDLDDIEHFARGLEQDAREVRAALERYKAQQGDGE